MSLRFHEIAEAYHRLQNPLNEADFHRLGQVCQLGEGKRVLDLACGKGEMLSQWAREFGIYGVGVDLSQVFIDAAKERAYQLNVGNKVNFVVGDVADFPQAHHEFDVVTCLGASWIGGGLTGTLNLMRSALKSRDGVLVIGEAFWKQPPTAEALLKLEMDTDAFLPLAAIVDQLESLELELVDMVIASDADWDRYEAMQWNTVYRFLEENSDDRDAHALQTWSRTNRRNYIMYGRDAIGWGVFVLRERIHLEDIPDRPANPDQPVGVDISNDMIWMRLQDGRVIGNPLAWYPWLKVASSASLLNIELTPIAVEWPELDQRLEVSTMLRGRK